MTLFGLQVPTINQSNGVADKEPNETLMKIRSDKVLRPHKKQQGKVRCRYKILNMFGVKPLIQHSL